MKKKKVIFIGAPPPYHGVTIFNEKMLNSKLCNVFDISHLDISDHRGLDNLGKFDLTNVFLAIESGVNPSS